MREPGARVVNSSTGRRMSTQQIEALYRRLENEGRREQAQAEVAKMEADLAEQLACWRDMPSVLKLRSYHEALKPQPLRFDRPSPDAPNLALEREELKHRIQTHVEASVPNASVLAPTGVAMLSLTVSIMLASVGGAKTPIIAIAATTLYWMAAAIGFIGTVTAVVVYWRSGHRRNVVVAQALQARLDAEWPARESDVRSRHEAAVMHVYRERERAQTLWSESERKRIEWAKRLLDGDVEAIETTVSDSLQDLDFPFEAKAEFALNGSTEGFLHIDLPEIEDVLPEVRHQVLNDGRIKEVKRPEVERNTEYTELCCGVGLLMAAATFAAAPTMNVVQVAAYTQREQKGRAKGQVLDEYVYVATIPRTLFTAINAKSLDATATLRGVAKMEQQANRRLKKLPPRELPIWVSDFADQ